MSGAGEEPLNVDEFSAFIAQATGLKLKVSGPATSIEKPRLPKNKKEATGKTLYGDSNDNNKERMISAVGGEVHGLSGMFSSLMTTSSTPPEDYRINATGAATGSHFNHMDRSKPAAGSHHSDESGEIDGTMGHKATRRGGKATRGRGDRNVTAHSQGPGREVRGYHGREGDQLPLPQRRDDRGDYERPSPYTSGGNYSTGVNYTSGGSHRNTDGRSVSLHTDTKQGQGLGKGQGSGQGQGPGQGLTLGHGQGQGLGHIPSRQSESHGYSGHGGPPIKHDHLRHPGQEINPGQGQGLGQRFAQGQGLGQGQIQGQGLTPGQGLGQRFAQGQGQTQGQGLGQGRDYSNNHRVVALSRDNTNIHDHTTAIAASAAATTVTAATAAHTDSANTYGNSRKNNHRGESTRARPSHGPPAVPFSSGAPLVHAPGAPLEYAPGGYNCAPAGYTINKTMPGMGDSITHGAVTAAGAVIGTGTSTTSSSSSSSSSMPYTSNPYIMSLPVPPAPQSAQSLLPQSRDSTTHNTYSNNSYNNSNNHNNNNSSNNHNNYLNNSSNNNNYNSHSNNHHNNSHNNRSVARSEPPHNNHHMENSGTGSMGGRAEGWTGGGGGGGGGGGAGASASGGGGGYPGDMTAQSNINTCFKNHKVITSWADADDSD